MIDPENLWGDLSREDEIFLKTLLKGYSKGTVWQSDGGSEFTGSWQKKGKSAFIKEIDALGAMGIHLPNYFYFGIIKE